MKFTQNFSKQGVRPKGSAEEYWTSNLTIIHAEVFTKDGMNWRISINGRKSTVEFQSREYAEQVCENHARVLLKKLQEEIDSE